MIAETVRTSRESTRRRPVREVAILAIAGMLLIAYAVSWSTLSSRQRAIADFSATYTAATIVRDGDVRHLYDVDVQATTGDRLLAPDHLILPYPEMAFGAVLAVPLTFLGLQAAFDVWTLLQLLLVLAAAVVAVRTAREGRPPNRLRDVAIVMVAVAGFGTANLLEVGQWTGFNALGVAMAYRCWRHGRYASGGVWLAAMAAIFKPHLGLGLFVFVLGWRNRRAMAGVAGTLLVAAAGLLAVVGIDGVRSFVQLALHPTAVYSARGGTSFFSLASMWYQDSTATYVVGYAGCCIALLICFLLGRQLGKGRARLDTVLAGATVLSLLAIPHTFAYDQVMIVPAIAWWLTDALSITAPRRGARVATGVVLVSWLAAEQLALLLPQIAVPLELRFGAVSAWCLIALAPAMLSQAQRRDTSPEVAGTHHPKSWDASGEGILGRVARTFTFRWRPRQESNLRHEV